MDERFIQALYNDNNLSELGSFDEFKVAMQNPAFQSEFHKSYLSSMGTLEEFQSALNLQQEIPPLTAEPEVSRLPELVKEQPVIGKVRTAEPGKKAPLPGSERIELGDVPAFIPESFENEQVKLQESYTQDEKKYGPLKAKENDAIRKSVLLGLVNKKKAEDISGELELYAQQRKDYYEGLIKTEADLERYNKEFQAELETYQNNLINTGDFEIKKYYDLAAQANNDPILSRARTDAEYRKGFEEKRGASLFDYQFEDDSFIDQYLMAAYAVPTQFASTILDQIPAGYYKTKAAQSIDFEKDVIVPRIYRETGVRFYDPAIIKKKLEEYKSRVGEEQYEKEKTEYIKSKINERLDYLKKASRQEGQAAALTYGLPDSFKEAKDKGLFGILQYSAKLQGQVAGFAALSLATAALTGGAAAPALVSGLTMYNVEKGEAYGEGLDLLKEKYNLTTEEILNKNLDADLRDASTRAGMINAALEYVGQLTVFGKAIPKNKIVTLIDKLAERAGNVPGLKAGAGITLATLGEGLTEWVQRKNTRIQNYMAVDKLSFSEAFDKAMEQDDTEDFLGGAVGGGGMHLISSAVSNEVKNRKRAPFRMAGYSEDQLDELSKNSAKYKLTNPLTNGKRYILDSENNKLVVPERQKLSQKQVMANRIDGMINSTASTGNSAIDNQIDEEAKVTGVSPFEFRRTETPGIKPLESDQEKQIGLPSAEQQGAATVQEGAQPEGGRAQVEAGGVLQVPTETPGAQAEVTGTQVTPEVTPQVGSVGVGGDVKDYKGIFNPKKTGISGLDDLLTDDGYNYFYKGVSGEVVMMSPDEYLKRAREGLKTKEDANIIEYKKDAINEAINEGNKIDMPFISTKDGKFSQEGRNRAVVARERGEKLIPVFIEKDVSFDDKITKGQEYINSAIKGGATTKEQVLSKLKEQGLHRDAIRFIDNNFDDKAVEQSLKETTQTTQVTPQVEAAKQVPAATVAPQAASRVTPQVFDAAKVSSPENLTAIETNSKAEIDKTTALPTADEGGATFNLDGTTYTGGGVVVPVTSVNLTKAEMTPQRIAQFVKDNAAKIGADNVKVGIYKFPNQDKYSVDLNIVVPQEFQQQGLDFARAAGQESIFDLTTFDNIKTGATGMTPAIFTDEQFKQIAADLAQGKVPQIASAEVTAERQKAEQELESALGVTPVSERNESEIQDAIDSATTALASLGVEVQALSSEEYSTAAKKLGAEETSRGMFVSEEGVIYINKDLLSKGIANNTVIWHEASHPVVNIIRNTNRKLYNQVISGLKQLAKTNEQVAAIQQQVEFDYAGETQERIDDEFLVETIANLSEGNIDLADVPKSLKQSVINLINEIARLLGLNPILSDTDVVAFKNLSYQIADALTTGKDLAYIVGKENVQEYMDTLDNPSVAAVGNLKSTAQYSKVTDSTAIDVYQSKEVKKLPIRSLSDIYSKFEGKVVVINSDPTKVGEIKLPSGKTVFMYGGPAYPSLKDNADNNIGFATTQIGKVGTWEKYINSLFKGKQGVTLVATQAPTSLLSNSYSLRYVMDAISQLPSDVLKSEEFKNEFFGESIVSLKDAFGEKKYNEFVNKYKESDLSDQSVVDSMVSEMAYTVGDNNSPASFKARGAFVSNLLGNIVEKSSRKGFEGQKGYVSVAPKKYIAKQLFEKFGLNKEKLMYELGEKSIVDLYINEGTWGVAVSGFEVDPSIKSESIQTKGVSHPLFNAKFPGKNAFILDGAYEVNKMFTPVKIVSKSGNKYTKTAAQMLAGSMYVKGQPRKQGKIFSFQEVPPVAPKIQYSRKAAGDLTVGTPYEKHMTSDNKDNFIFFHTTSADYKDIKPGLDSRKFYSTRTSRDEKALQYGVASYYTKPTDSEPMVLGDSYYVKVPMSKVYPMNTDPNGYEAQAEQNIPKNEPFRYEKVRKEMARLAKDDGYQMAVAYWGLDEKRGSVRRGMLALRGDALVPLKPKPFVGAEDFNVGPQYSKRKLTDKNKASVTRALVKVGEDMIKTGEATIDNVIEKLRNFTKGKYALDISGIENDILSAINVREAIRSQEFNVNNSVEEFTNDQVEIDEEESFGTTELVDKMASYLAGKVTNSSQVKRFVDEWNKQNPDKEVKSTEVWNKIDGKPVDEQMISTTLTKIIQEKERTKKLAGKDAVKQFKDIVQYIRDAVKGTKLTWSQTKAILSKLKGITYLTPERTAKVKTYVDKVVADAKVAQKIHYAEKLRKKLKKAPTKTAAPIKAIAKKLASIEITDENIDEFIIHASSIINSYTRPDRETYAGVRTLEIEVFIDNESRRQENELTAALLSAAEESEAKYKSALTIAEAYNNPTEQVNSIDDIVDEQLNLSEEKKRITRENLIAIATGMRNMLRDFPTIPGRAKEKAALERFNPTTATLDTIVQYIKVVNNAILNNNFAGTGRIIASINAQSNVNQAIAAIKANRRVISALGRFGRVYTKFASNVAATYDKLMGGKDAAIEFLTYIGLADYLEKNAQFIEEKNEIQRLVDAKITEINDKYKVNVLSEENQIKRRVLSELAKYVNDPTASVPKVIRNIEADIKELLANNNPELTPIADQLYELLNDMRSKGALNYNVAPVTDPITGNVKFQGYEFSDGDITGSSHTVQGYFEKNHPAVYELWDYNQKIYNQKNVFNRASEVNEKFYNELMNEYKFYSATVFRKVGEGIVSEDAYPVNSLRPAQSNRFKEATRSRKAGYTYSYIQSFTDDMNALFEVLHDIYTTESQFQFAESIVRPELIDPNTGLFTGQKRDFVIQDYKRRTDIDKQAAREKLDELALLLDTGSRVAKNIANTTRLFSVKQVIAQWLPAYGSLVAILGNKAPLLHQTVPDSFDDVLKLTPAALRSAEESFLNLNNKFNLTDKQLQGYYGKAFKALGGVEKGSKELSSFMLKYPIGKPDFNIYKRGWVALYTKSLMDQGVTDVNLETENTMQEDPRRVKARYTATFEMTKLMAASDPASKTQLSKSRGYLAALVGVMMPFSAFQLNYKDRIITALYKIKSKEGMVELGAALTESLVFASISVAWANYITDFVATYMAENLLGIDLGDDEEGEEETLFGLAAKTVSDIATRMYLDVNPMAISYGENVMLRTANFIEWLSSDTMLNFNEWLADQDEEQPLIRKTIYDPVGYPGMLREDLTKALTAGQNLYNAYVPEQGIYVMKNKDFPDTELYMDPFLYELAEWNAVMSTVGLLAPNEAKTAWRKVQRKAERLKAVD